MRKLMWVGGAIGALAGVAWAGPPAGNGGPSPEARGKAVLKAQLAAMADEEALVATFARQATVLTPSRSSEVHEENWWGGATIAELNPHAEIVSRSFDHFVAGGNSEVVWFGADLHFTVVSHEPQEEASTAKFTVRVIELLDGAAEWKPAVAAFTRVDTWSTYGKVDVVDATEVGPLASLMTSPSALGAALGDGAIVYGNDPNERAMGLADGRALTRRWQKLPIAFTTPPKVHEVHAATYGYATGAVTVTPKPGGPVYKLSAFVLALPRIDGTWSVIGASYGQ